MKRIAILGSTGSIGSQALDIVRANPDLFQITVLSCATRIDELKSQIKEFSPELVVVEKETQALHIAKEYPHIQVAFGEEGLIAAAVSKCDLLLNSLMGIRGLVPTYHAIEAGHNIAFANKETLVAGGELIMKKVKEKGVDLLPVDSEHSAIFQCLMGNDGKKIKRLILTASGGPFRGYSIDMLKSVTPSQALCHPKWKMGSKITVDSATMMNKGLEIIEAKWLFDVDEHDIEVVVHPQSIVHSMVEFSDTSVMAQMGLPDMRVPLSLAFSYPERLENDFPSLNLLEEGRNLTFEKPDNVTFRCMDLAREACRKGGSYPVVMNGVNEVLVQRFIDGKIKFLDIQEGIEQAMHRHEPVYNLSIDEIMEIDREARSI